MHPPRTQSHKHNESEAKEIERQLDSPNRMERVTVSRQWARTASSLLATAWLATRFRDELDASRRR